MLARGDPRIDVANALPGGAFPASNGRDIERDRVPEPRAANARPGRGAHPWWMALRVAEDKSVLVEPPLWWLWVRSTGDLLRDVLPEALGQLVCPVASVAASSSSEKG
jgi:hypothetical protein